MNVSREKNIKNHLHSIKSIFEDKKAVSFNLFQHMPIGICITNMEGYFTDVNATYCDIYGYTREELIGKKFTAMVPEESKEELMKYHHEFMEKEFELQGRWTVQNKEKEKFEILANAAFLKDANTGDKSKMTLVVRAEELEDTFVRLETTVQILERKLETQDIANRLAEHDLRNRLSSIVSVADILSKTQIDDNQRKWVETIKRVGKDTLHLLASARDFAKMERGEYLPQYVLFDVISSLASVTKDFMNLIDEKKVEINMFCNDEEIEPGSDELFINGDQFYLEHLFQNLIGNAIDASPENGTIDILIMDGSDFKIRISNAGMIPIEIQKNFFEKYTTSGKDRGTGLGTYIAQMVARFHGGDITFESTATEGTALTIRIPKEKLLT
ncbi:sensor histidine kinase [Nonlabens antarcticus]|uniref:sensor histidine kinase n=1 Tax=Nonlabens antarcticus TaxID=392714 RepID=UPI0018910F24|nr:PAS domain-containing sensor histidine kinase [Nonlabens antarcticus]